MKTHVKMAEIVPYKVSTTSVTALMDSLEIIVKQVGFVNGMIVKHN